jgi:lactoylglutathione lyase
VITHVATVGIYVRDQDVALRFYTETLGFEVRKKVDTPEMKWYEVAPPGGQTTLVLGSKNFGTFDESKVGKYTDIAFNADNIHELYEIYTKRGVKFTAEPRLEPYGMWFASFVDQDNNEFFVFQPVSE